MKPHQRRRDLAVPAWVWPTLILGGMAFLCTRGSDGSLGGAVLGFAAAGVIYWIGLARGRRIPLRQLAAHLFLFELAVVAGMAIRPGLEEMASMLYLFIPVFVLLMVVGGGVVSFVRWLRTPRSSPADDCPACGYNLTGNISGVCPECGRSAAPAVGQAAAGPST